MSIQAQKSAGKLRVGDGEKGSCANFCVLRRELARAIAGTERGSEMASAGGTRLQRQGEYRFRVVWVKRSSESLEETGLSVWTWVGTGEREGRPGWGERERERGLLIGGGGEKRMTRRASDKEAKKRERAKDSRMFPSC
eukprot:293550-Pleurochrysis_carterae.AAC.2